MKTTTYTPGPWRNMGNCIISESTGDCIAIPGSKDARFRLENEQDNAALIAAAPDLLAALEAVTARLAEWLDGVEDPDSADTDALAAARAVIDQARGEG